MCDEAEYHNDVDRETIVRARQGHECGACQEAIRPGDRYVRHVIIYAGSAEVIKRCLRCDNMLSAIKDARPDCDAFDPRLNCGENWRDTIGELPDDVAALAFATRAEMQAIGVKR